MKEIKQMLLGIVLILIGIYIACYIGPMDSPSFDAANFLIFSHFMVLIGAFIAVVGFFEGKR